LQVSRIDPPEIEVELTPRQRFVALLREARDNHPDLSPGELADEIAATLPDEDRELVESYLASEARNILALELSRQDLTNRAQIFHVFDLKNPKAPPVAQRSEKVKNTLYDRIEEWREFVPSQRRSRALFDMTRDELRESARFDLSKTYHHAFKARLKLQLAERLKGTQVVSDLYDAEAIVDLTQRIKTEMNRGNFRLKITPVDALPGADSVQG
jgi:hypothetical protein